MPVNQYGQNYNGNDDFRGWLAAGGAGNISPYALGLSGIGPLNSQGTYSYLLKNVGNDGKSGNASINPASQKLYQQWQAGRVATPAPANPTGSSGGGSSSYVDKTNDIKLQESGLASADSQLTSGIAAVDKALKGLYGQYDTEAQANEKNYGTQSDTNQNNRQRGIQTSYVNAAQGRRGLFGVLASLGALNGSGIDLANKAVQAGANEDLSGTNDTYQSNQVNLDTGIDKFRREDKQRRQNADTAATDARTNVKNQVAKSKQQFYTNLANDYAAMGNTAKAQEYTRLAASLYPELAVTSVPSSNLAYTGAAYTPATLANFIADGNTLVSTSGASDAYGIPTLVASSSEKRRQLV